MPIRCREIGGDFLKIFAEIVKINNLDYQLISERIQQTIIETLDTCQWVEIKGKEDNETDLIIHLHELEDVRKQTNFENCVADVNIPVGEVFTSSGACRNRWSPSCKEGLSSNWITV
ncbi:MAG: hypothetical protein ACLUD0_17290 [Eubacterium ramulus]